MMNKNTTLAALQKRALEIRDAYCTINQQSRHHTWAGKDYAMGFVGDVGDLVKLVMAKENMRNIENVDAKLEHELGDCLWSLFVLADYYNVDLGKAFETTMNELEKKISK